MTANVAKAKLRGHMAVRLVRACGGWKYREGIPMHDEEVRRQGERATREIPRAFAELAIARRVLWELGRDGYLEQRIREEGL